MHSIKFYPVGNGDCTQIILENGKRILLDYRQHTNAGDARKPEIDLAKELKSDLSAVNRDNFDIVAFTHADKDHIEGCTEFFELDFAEKYQGEERIKIDELWVPAAILIEKADDADQSNESVILRQEARHRLKLGYGIKIFSKPEKLISLMRQMGIDPDEREHLIIDAGTLVDSLDLDQDGVEFFCHSPYMKHCDDNDSTKEVRNEASLAFNIRFKYSELIYDMLAFADPTCEVIADIVNITEYHERKDRLSWNILNIPHHCSYLALAPSGEKGDQKTTPIEEVERLLLYGKANSYMVCSSRPIENDKAAYEQVQPPHVQAKNTYTDYLSKVGGRKFLVTMEEPSTIHPKPMQFDIDSSGLSYAALILSGTGTAAAAAPSRAGISDGEI